MYYIRAPQVLGDRSDSERAVYALLERLHIPFLRADHEAVFTMEACEAVSEALGAPICKNLFLCNRQKTDFYLLLLPAEKRFQTKDVSRQLDCARLSFADADALQAYLHLTPGSATIFGLLYDTEHRIRLLVDRALLEQEFFCCHPCINTSTLRLKTADVFGPLTEALQHPYTLITL